MAQLEEANSDAEEATTFPLDDPVIDGMKRHLAIGSRIGLEPISPKFARIAFFYKRRMTMKLIESFFHDGFLQLKVKIGNGESEHLFDIRVSSAKAVFRSLVRRIRKWRSIANELFGGVARSIDGRLLDAILSESGETIDIRHFDCGLCTIDKKLIEFLRRCAPNLRHLKLSLMRRDGTVEQPSMPSVEFALAIESCQKLRQLWLHRAPAALFSPDFLHKILTLPQLSDLLLGDAAPVLVSTANDGTRRQYVRRHCPGLSVISIDDNWLQLISNGLPQLPPLKNMQHFRLLTTSHNDVLLDVMWKIVGEMRSPASVDLDYAHSDVSWQRVFSDYLPMVFKTGANVERNLMQGLPVITTEDYHQGLASLPPFIQNALTPPDLANAPVKHNRYQKQEFNFFGGAKITFKTYWP